MELSSIKCDSDFDEMEMGGGVVWILKVPCPRLK